MRRVLVHRVRQLSREPSQELIARQASVLRRIAVYRAPAQDDFRLLTTSGRRATIGALAEPLGDGPTSRFDLGNALEIDLLGGSLASVTDLSLFLGANALAVETAPGIWEIVQAGTAELVAPGRYRLTRLLRGQRGTEWAIAASVPAGARVVVLDERVIPLLIAAAEVGLEWTWRVGPAPGLGSRSPAFAASALAAASPSRRWSW